MDSCGTCGGTGELDPFEVHDGSPLFTDCRHCFGLADPTCGTCDGQGIVVVTVDCPACSVVHVTHHDAAA